MNITLKKINHHLLQAFVRDFPFNLVVAYRMTVYVIHVICMLGIGIPFYYTHIITRSIPHRKSNIYLCDEMGGMFIRGCITKMESMDPRVAATTLMGFLQK